MTQIIALITSGIPISIILIALINKFFYKHNPDIAKTTVICTDLIGPLTKKLVYPKNLFVDKDVIKIKYDKNLVEILDTETKEEIKVEKNYLRHNEAAQLAAISANICGYERLRETEEVIRKFFMECGFNKIKIFSEYEKIQDLPSSEEKKLSTSVAIKNDSRDIFAFTKGNPYKVLNICSRILLNGKKQELTQQMKTKFKKEIKRLNMDGQKVIAFAYKGLPIKRLPHYTESFTESDLIFTGMIGMGHPLNTDLKESINWAKDNGIKIYITTTNQDRKAVSAATNLGIINPHYFETVTGGDFEINDKKLSKLLQNKEKDFVFAELKPEYKTTIIETLQEMGETVAVASKKPGGNLNSIVDEIKKQRAYIVHSRKFLYHGFSFAIAAFLLNLTAIILQTPIPLSMNILLVINIFVNLSIELSLRKDPLPQNMENRQFQPVSPKIKVSRIFTLALGMYLITAGLYFFTLTRYGWTLGENVLGNEEIISKTSTIVFTLMIFIQVLNGFNLRYNKKSLFRLDTLLNPYLILTSVISLLVLMLISTSVELKKILGLISLSELEIEMIMLSATGIVFIEEIRKYITRRRHGK